MRAAFKDDDVGVFIVSSQPRGSAHAASNATDDDNGSLTHDLPPREKSEASTPPPAELPCFLLFALRSHVQRSFFGTPAIT
jgi:hypothetical protein